MSEEFVGTVHVKRDDTHVTLTLDGLTGDITAGGNGQDGDLVLRDTAGNERLTEDTVGPWP